MERSPYRAFSLRNVHEYARHVCPFRIIYRIANRNVLEVIAAGPRERIYEQTYRLVRKEVRNQET